MCAGKGMCVLVGACAHMCILGQIQYYRKVPKFSNTRKLCRYLPKIQIKKPNLRVFHQKDANGMENSEDSNQTALGAV